MPKFDNQGRLSIPSDLSKKMGWDFPKELAFCYDFESKILSFCDSSDISNKNVLSIRQTDNKGRFFLPKELIDSLGIARDSTFIIFLKNNEFIIKVM